MKLFKLSAIIISLLFLFTFAKSQTKPESATKIMKEAEVEAAKTNKNVFVIFHASWCIWCHRMDTAMNDNSIKYFFDNNFEIIHLTVDENYGKKDLENPGANELRTQFHGDQQGIPFWVIIDKNGKVLADSRIHSDDGKLNGNNVGCPSRPDEITYFIKVLKKTSPMTDDQLALIQARFMKIGQ